ncbi:ATP-binding protein [Sporosarcina luteola]|uniref:ATP-binding protein n=1 Tax=Bacillales TaxID=1385 RepID=UPI00203D53A3|nr:MULTISPECIES: ATP-binding protein [Bacillales]MCM3638051.1 ATP-binding protein [Sporosarcina luteola]
MSDFDSTLKSMSFLLDDSFRPMLVLQVNGDIYYENEPFKMHFDITDKKNISEIIDSTSLCEWTGFSERARTSEQILMEKLSVTLCFDENGPSQLQLFYIPDIKKIIAKFDLQEPCKIPSLKTYFNAFRQSSDFLLLVDQDGKIRDVNEVHSVFINQTRKELIGQSIGNVLSIIDPENDESVHGLLEKVKDQGFVESIKTYQRSTEDTRYYHITTYYDKETNMFIFQMSDSTEIENLQVQLAHSGSLSAVGQIAASIAHEIRNPITTLKGFTQLLKVSATDDSIRYISVIEDEIERMETILGEMLVLSKPSEKKKSVFSLEVLVGDMVSILLPKAVMDGIEVAQSVELNSNPHIFGDPDKMKQVLLNLFKNALESMQVGGKLAVHLSESDGKLILSITDTGKGMTRHQVSQVFMPFFSSKPGGTGLGLPFVLKTVEDHGGTIAVDSQVDVGTKFILTFPKAKEGASYPLSSKQSIVS